MRTLTAAERAYVSDPAGHDCFAALDVTADDGATWLTLASLAVGANTRDFFNTAQITNSIDSNTVSFSATLKREIDVDSLSPFRTDSAANDSVVSPGTYAPALDLQRKWRIRAAIVPKGTIPDISDYREMESGYLRTLTVNGTEDTIAVAGIGLEAPILDAFVVDDRSYNDAMEDVIQGALDDQLGSGIVTLYTPTSPSFVVADVIGDINLMPALSDIAALTGWSLRYRYDASDVNRLTLFEPNRSATVADWSIAATEYEDLSASLDIAGVRNYIKVRYQDATSGIQTVISPGAESGTVSCVGQAATFSASQAGVLADGALIVVDDVGYRVSDFDGTTGATLVGAPDFSTKQFYTSASLTKYGLQTFVIDLAAGTQITDATAAGNLADAVRADREDPALVQSFKAPGLWFVQLHDYVGTTANAVHYDEDQAGGVTSYTHDFSDGMLVTTVNLAGKPKGRYTTWKRIGSGAPASATAPTLTSLDATFSEVVFLFTIPVIQWTAVAGPSTYSVHAEYSDDSTFATTIVTQDVAATPGDPVKASTILATTADRDTTYYVRCTPYSGALVAGAVSGTAGEQYVANTYAAPELTDSSTVTVNRSVSGAISFDAVAGSAIVPTATTLGQIGIPLDFVTVPENDQWLALSTIPDAETEVGTEYRQQSYAVGVGSVRIGANIKTLTGTPTIGALYSTDSFGSTAALVSFAPGGTGVQYSGFAAMPSGAQADIGVTWSVADGSDTAALDLYRVWIEYLPTTVSGSRVHTSAFAAAYD